MDRTLPLTTLAALALSLPLVLVGCGGKVDTLAFARTTQGESTPLGSFDDCPVLASNVTAVAGNGQVMITKACFKDDLGKYYDALLSDGPVPSPGLAVLPAGRKYAFVVQFGDGWVPTAAAAATPDVARAYAAPDNIYSEGPCMELPEDREANRVAATATLAGNVLTFALTDGVPSGDQVDTTLDFGLLYPTVYASTPGEIAYGFNARFYVDHAPSPTSSCGALDASAE